MALFDELFSGIYSMTVTDAAVLVREVRVRIGILPKFVTIRIYYDPKHGERPFTFETSDLLNTPLGRELAEADRREATEPDALRRAVRMLTDGYEDAVRRGELPEDGWLVQPR